MRPSAFLITASLMLAPAMSLAQASASAPVASSPAVNDATRVVDEFHQAVKGGDLAAAAALLTENAVIFEHGGVERSKGAYIGHHLPADAAYSKDLTETVTARASELSGDLAYVITDGRTTGSYNGKPVDSRTTETMILRRLAGGWRIMHIHWSSARSSGG